MKDFLLKHKIIPVVVIKELADTLPTLKALAEGGLPVAEITFRTPCAADAIALAAKELPRVTVGAGTVINADQCRAAVAAGAKFIVGPGFSLAVAQVARSAGVPYLPGCVTPTEIMAALEAGIETVKFFPASVYGGIAAVKALAAPFPQVKFVPTGGVDASNLLDYLALPQVAAIGGSFMMKGTPDEIRAKTAAAVALIKGENK